MSYSQYLKVLVDEYTKKEYPRIVDHPEIREMLDRWIKRFSDLIDLTLATDFYDSSVKTQIQDLSYNLKQEIYLTISGGHSPDWAYMFFLMVTLEYLLSVFLYPMAPPPKGVTKLQVALYYLHPACPFKTQKELAKLYDMDTGDLSRAIDKVRGLIDTHGWLGTWEKLRT